MSTIRQPAVAGAFYPAQALVLAHNIASMLESGASDVTHTAPKAIIVPHAGYIYSGNTAAVAYASLAKARNQIKRVVILGPVHRVPVHGLALPGVTGFATPLGTVGIDQAGVNQVSHLPQVVTSLASHALEHSIEVQLPFLQTVLGEFEIIPFAVGDTTPVEVAEVLDTLWGGPETLIVVSSDLSHFMSYDNARDADQKTVQRILNLNGPLNHEQACGGMPINGLLLAAQRHHLQPQLLRLCNSGDTSGDKSRVVGYASFAFMEVEPDHAH